jgi:hypothetical protein
MRAVHALHATIGLSSQLAAICQQPRLFSGCCIHRLYHTFHGGCNPNPWLGDAIIDTPGRLPRLDRTGLRIDETPFQLDGYIHAMAAQHLELVNGMGTSLQIVRHHFLDSVEASTLETCGGSRPPLFQSP